MRRFFSMLLLSLLALLGPVEPAHQSRQKETAEAPRHCCCDMNCGCTSEAPTTPTSSGTSRTNGSPCSSSQAPCAPATSTASILRTACWDMNGTPIREAKPWPQELTAHTLVLERLSALQPRAPDPSPRRLQDHLAHWGYFRI